MSNFRRWLSLWRVERLEMWSPLPVEVAEERLVAGVTSPRERVPGRPAHGAVDVVGRVGRQKVSVCALPPQFRMNSFKSTGSATGDSGGWSRHAPAVSGPRRAGPAHHAGEG